MKQYEKVMDDFVFLGTVPSDCPTKISCELSKFDPEKMKKNGITKVGIVYNLDQSYQNGSHWVAIYMDLLNNEINYYDSCANLPNKLIKQFIDNIAKKIEIKNKEVHIIYNDKKHQFGNSECGMYSMNFLLERLYGTTMFDISQMTIKDEDMNRLRQFLYYIEKK